MSYSVLIDEDALGIDAKSLNHCKEDKNTKYYVVTETIKEGIIYRNMKAYVLCIGIASVELIAGSVLLAKNNYEAGSPITTLGAISAAGVLAWGIGDAIDAKDEVKEEGPFTRRKTIREYVCKETPIQREEHVVTIAGKNFEVVTDENGKARIPTSEIWYEEVPRKIVVKMKKAGESQTVKLDTNTVEYFTNLLTKRKVDYLVGKLRRGLMLEFHEFGYLLGESRCELLSRYTERWPFETTVKYYLTKKKFDEAESVRQMWVASIDRYLSVCRGKIDRMVYLTQRNKRDRLAKIVGFNDEILMKLRFSLAEAIERKNWTAAEKLQSMVTMREKAYREEQYKQEQKKALEELKSAMERDKQQMKEAFRRQQEALLAEIGRLQGQLEANRRMIIVQQMQPEKQHVVVEHKQSRGYEDAWGAVELITGKKSKAAHGAARLLDILTGK